MSKFLDDIEQAIKSIHASNGLDDAAISKQIADTIGAAISPMQTEIAELQKALQDTVAKLSSGDVEGAQATANAALNPAPAAPAAPAESGTDGEGSGQAVS